MSEKLPANWIELELEKILSSLQSGSRPKGGVKGILNGIPSIGGEHLNNTGGFNFLNTRFIPEEYYKKLAKGHINENDILIVKDGATTGKVAYVDKKFPFMKAVINEHVFIVRVSAPVISKVVFYFLWSKEGNERVLKNFQGSAQGGINRQFISNTLIPLPPLNEQKRIVAKLDAIMPRIEAVNQRLEKIPCILKRFRQSVLTAAVTGKLTEKWREEHPEVESAEVLLKRIRKERKKKYIHKKIATPSNYKHIDINDIEYLLPQKWQWCRLAQIVKKMSTGPFGSMLHKSDYIENGIPVINPTNIKGSMLVPSENMLISETKFTELSRYALQENNIVIARRGDLSKCGIVMKKEAGWLCGTGSFFLDIGIEPSFFRLFYISNFCQSVLNENAIGSTMSNLNQNVLSNIAFPLPPLEEQKEIVKQVDKLFALADKVEAHYQKAKDQVDKLSQSVLAKAFKGELVPQDLNDEPAEKLLERILEEKAKMEKELKKAKKRTPMKKAVKNKSRNKV